MRGSTLLRSHPCVRVRCAVIKGLARSSYHSRPIVGARTARTKPFLPKWQSMRDSTRENGANEANAPGLERGILQNEPILHRIFTTGRGLTTMSARIERPADELTARTHPQGVKQRNEANHHRFFTISYMHHRTMDACLPRASEADESRSGRFDEDDRPRIGTGVPSPW